MTRYSLGFLLGFAAFVGSGLVLWFTVPFVFSTLFGNSESWLALFPIFTFVPALLLGGYTAARLVPDHRVILGFVVGLVATVFAGFLAHGSGQVLYLSIAVLLGGVLSAIGARLAGEPAARRMG